jgi:hypothetical protein
MCRDAAARRLQRCDKGEDGIKDVETKGMSVARRDRQMCGGTGQRHTLLWAHSTNGEDRGVIRNLSQRPHTCYYGVAKCLQAVVVVDESAGCPQLPLRLGKDGGGGNLRLWHGLLSLLYNDGKTRRM